MRTSFYEKLINSIEKVETTTLDERVDKSNTIIDIATLIAQRGGSVEWNGKKWIVTER